MATRFSSMHIIGKNRIRKNENKDIGINLYFRQELLKVVASVTEAKWKSEGVRKKNERKQAGEEEGQDGPRGLIRCEEKKTGKSQRTNTSLKQK